MTTYIKQPLVLDVTKVYLEPCQASIIVFHR